MKSRKIHKPCLTDLTWSISHHWLLMPSGADTQTHGYTDTQTETYTDRQTQTDRHRQTHTHACADARTHRHIPTGKTKQFQETRHAPDLSVKIISSVAC